MKAEEKKIFESGELNEQSTCAFFAQVADNGKTYRYKFYALPAIIAVGYRVNSQRATQFRQWATKGLDTFTKQGYVLDKSRLINGRVFDEDYFYRNTIQEVYQQLQSSYNELFSVAPPPLLKIILLYEEFSNAAIIEQPISEMFLNDPTCYIMTVQDFEILLYTHKHNYPQFKNVLNSMTHPKVEGTGRKCATVILEEYSLRDNLHLDGEMDYFKILLKHFGSQLE